VEGFSESLYFELKPFNIRVKVIEPGIIDTDFYNRSMDQVDSPDPGYEMITLQVNRYERSFAQKGSPPEVVARTIFRAATDGRWQFRYYTGKFARTMLILRKVLLDWLFHSLVKRFVFR